MAATVASSNNFKTFCLRLQSALRIRRKKATKANIQISAPFDFRKDTFILPGFSKEECVRMKNAALSGSLNPTPMTVSIHA